LALFLCGFVAVAVGLTALLIGAVDEVALDGEDDAPLEDGEDERPIPVHCQPPGGECITVVSGLKTIHLRFLSASAAKTTNQPSRSRAALMCCSASTYCSRFAGVFIGLFLLRVPGGNGMRYLTP